MSSRMRRVSVSAADVADRWLSQYFSVEHGWTSVVSGNARQIHDKLCALGPNPKASAIDKIIGNKSWTHSLCEGCGKYVKAAVEIGESYESKVLCAKCLMKAQNLLKAGV